jgi:putative Mg2+ transporter-C (MgtC) family protein
MDTLWHEVWKGIHTDFSDLPDVVAVTQLLLRLGLAAILGGLLGFQRERAGRPAGLRTHMLVALGSALFVLIPLQAGMPLVEMGRVLQGLTTGIGFLGAGTILKRGVHIEGLTTAASLWVTAAVGVAAGMGREMSAVLGTVLTFIILAFIPRMGPKRRPKDGA